MRLGGRYKTKDGKTELKEGTRTTDHPKGNRARLKGQENEPTRVVKEKQPAVDENGPVVKKTTVKKKVLAKKKATAKAAKE